MAHRLQQLLLILSTGFILYYFSEFVFWSGGTPDSWTPRAIAAGWLVYSIGAAAFLIVVRFFGARAPWGLFLAGAIFGWLVEGIYVQTMVESLPLSISFTGLAWHALLTICAGWYGLRRALQDERRWLGPAAAAVAGLLWGLWAIYWWQEADQIHRTVAAFGAVNLLGTALLVVANLLFERAGPADFRPGRWTAAAVFGFFAVWFFIVAIPAAPVSAVVVPLALAVALWALWRGRSRGSGRPDALDAVAPPIGGRLLWLLLMPVSATAVYAVADALGLTWFTNYVLYAITTPLGFILLGMSLWQVGWKQPAAEAETPAASYSDQS
jgi:hypothetical protein